jgi:hypothetical protein
MERNVRDNGYYENDRQTAGLQVNHQRPHPHARGNLALFFAQGMGVNGRGFHVRMAHPFLQHVQLHALLHGMHRSRGAGL